MIFNPIVKESQASLEKEDLDKVLRIIQPYKPERILEIGMWKGFSADTWIKSFNPYVLVTLERDHKHEDGFYYEGDPRFHYLWDVDSTSDQTLDQVKAICPEYDMAFIDGGHEYSTVRRDLELYVPLVKDGGVIVMHDVLYKSDACQVNMHWEHIKRHYDYIEVNCGNGSTGIGIIFKGAYYDTKLTGEPRQ